jgi:hypothetical protein
VIVRTLEEMPRGATHWSTRGMAKARRAFGLQPHRTEAFKLSTDPLLIEKGRDAIALCCARSSRRASVRAPRTARSASRAQGWRP